MLGREGGAALQPEGDESPVALGGYMEPSLGSVAMWGGAYEHPTAWTRNVLTLGQFPAVLQPGSLQGDAVPMLGHWVSGEPWAPISLLAQQRQLTPG